MFLTKQMLKKARQEKHGSHPTILAGWYAQERCRDQLAEHNIGEKEVMFFDRIAHERHDYIATRTERLQNSKHWILRLNADGPLKPLRRRPEFAVALKQCLQMQGAHLAEKRQSQTDTSRTSTTATKRSTVWRRSKLRLLCRSKNRMAVLRRAMVKPASSVIFNFAVANFTMANEVVFMAVHII